MSSPLQWQGVESLFGALIYDFAVAHVRLERHLVAVDVSNKTSELEGHQESFELDGWSIAKTDCEGIASPVVP